ncbi:hypothetical protein [Neomoorella mulderi]|uniref:Uncharacterized protein n=1 Tax=Moorella mulderi DSM 14980 TaxID=1122241 RepID=A0A151B0V2_9FIRM|nr:hypothetical protein [Moorella mulderi]KYH33516.1 hypothetical protein MOMUL_02170 [Moorella mulderi DSM 14980]
MTLATCNRHCSYLNDGACELAGILEQGQPVLCPYRHRETAALTGEVSFPPARLPRSLATPPHYRYPGTNPVCTGSRSSQGISAPPEPGVS